MKDLRDWMFRALMFESEAEQFRKSGIRLGANIRDTERSLLDEALAPFPLSLRNESLQMMRMYAIIYCFENSVREIVRERLEDNFGVNWWEKGVPAKVRKIAESRQNKANENSWLEGEKADLLSFAEFGDLSDIIVNKWDSFSDLIPTQHWIKQRFDELEQARNFVAHNRMLLPSERNRIELYISDWNKQVGL